MRQHECRDEAANQIAESAKYADDEQDRAERQPDRRVKVVLKNQQASCKCRHGTASGRGYQVDFFGIYAYQRHHLPILTDGPDRRSEKSSVQEQVSSCNGGDRDKEADDARPRQTDLAEIQRRQVDADILVFDAEHHGRCCLQEEQHAAGHQQLVDRLG